MTRSSASSTGSRPRVKQRDIPKNGAFNTLVYFSCRDPRRVKGIRAVYHDDVDDSVSVGSGSSMWSIWSSSSQSNVQYYFIEPRGYWAEPQDYEPARKSKPRTSGRPRAPPPNPAAAWARNATVHDAQDDSDSDDGSDASHGEFGPQGGPPRGPGPFMRPPGVMPMSMPSRGAPSGLPHMGGPPAGFQPPFGMGPRPSPHPQMGQRGHGIPPPPPAMARVPPPPGGFPPGGVFRG